MLSPFPAGARVVFAGDSITCVHDHVARIAAHYKLFEPSRKVSFWNAGISGGTLDMLLERFEADVARVRPTHVPLMIGINDSDRDALRLDPADPVRRERLDRALSRYLENLDRFLGKLAAIGAQPILCTPTPYAEFNPFTGWDKLPGGYALILRYADAVRRIAAERGLPLVDFHAALAERYTVEPLYGDDCVHPTPAGQALMAKTFLEAQGLSPDAFATAEEAVDAAGLREWLEAWRRYRNLVTAHYLCFTEAERALPLEKRIEILAARTAEEIATKRPGREWFHDIGRIYVKDAARNDEIVARLDRMNAALFGA